jgi:hypothetical protein
MALGLPLKRGWSARGAARVFASTVCLVFACHARDKKTASQLETVQKAEVKATSAPGSSAPAPSPIPPPSPAFEPSASFLIAPEGHGVSIGSLDGATKVLAPRVSSWLHDPAHGLLWYLDEGQLSVIDLQPVSEPQLLAKDVPSVAAFWVEWPADDAAQFVRRETGCGEDPDAVELHMGSTPKLRTADSGRRLALLPQGLRWLKAQARRKGKPLHAMQDFDSDAPHVALPANWSGCDEQDNCGLSRSFGSGSLRLVLVKERLSGDCAHRSCLLFNNETRQFASPPVLVRAEDGALSLAPVPVRWTSAEQAVPGSCGPYLFDQQGTRFLVRSFLCTLNDACHDLGGEGIGWLQPGVVVGGPG